jgi:uncharacterized protein (TIGR03086 family)
VSGGVGRENHHALELLERALGYTRVALSNVGRDRSSPSPCAGWSLADLLDHMDDGLDAFLEAAGGSVDVPSPVPVPERAGADLEVLQAKACQLLGVWSAPTPQVVAIGDRSVPARLLVSAAALEIAVHGWDVGQATGSGDDLPEDLARALMPVAHAVVTPDDRPGRFAPPLRTGQHARSSEVLLGFLGRASLPG